MKVLPLTSAVTGHVWIRNAEQIAPSLSTTKAACKLARCVVCICMRDQRKRCQHRKPRKGDFICISSVKVRFGKILRQSLVHIHCAFHAPWHLPAFGQHKRPLSPAQIKAIWKYSPNSPANLASQGSYGTCANYVWQWRILLDNAHHPNPGPSQLAIWGLLVGEIQQLSNTSQEQAQINHTTNISRQSSTIEKPRVVVFCLPWWLMMCVVYLLY